MHADADGTLVRSQTWPQMQTSRIGKRFVTVTKNGGEPNLLPIPSDLRPWISALRSVLIGQPLPPGGTADLVQSTPHWQVNLSVPGPNGYLILTGCGPELWSIAMMSPDQIRRVLSIQPPA